MIVKNLIVSGDSFSYGGIGGCPPTLLSVGGCSYIPDVDCGCTEPNIWPGFLARQLSVQSLVNTATSAHGNILISYTIFEILKKYTYNIEDTLIIFNLTDPNRLDTPCDFNNENADNLILWDEKLISHSYLTKPSTPIISDAVEKYTSESVRFLMEYLKLKGFKFYFLLMSDYTEHKYLGPIIKQFRDHIITLNPGPSMIEFAVHTKNTVSKKDLHPNINGHRLIADQVYEYINNKYDSKSLKLLGQTMGMDDKAIKKELG